MTEAPVLSDRDRDEAVSAVVDQMVATRALVSALQAHEASLLAAAMGITVLGSQSGNGSSADMPIRSLAAELGAALRVSDRSIQRQLSEALTLTERFPATFEAMSAGRISRAHATVIMDAGCHLVDAEIRAAYEASVLPYAEAESASRLRPVARLRAERIAPSSPQERHDRARKRRGVHVCDLDDGMGQILAILPSALVHGAYDRLTQLGATSRTARRVRPM